MSVVNNELVADRSESISKIPSVPSLMSSLGFLKVRTSNQDNVTFDVRDGSIKVLSDKLRSVADVNTIDERQFDQHLLKIPYFPQSSVISRDNFAGIREFGKDTDASLASVIAQHLEDHQANIDNHIEYVTAKMVFDSALVTDNYSTYDMATEFGVSQGAKTLSWAAAGDTLKQLREMQNAAKAGLVGGRASGFILLAGDSLYEWLITNEDFVRAFEMQAFSGSNPLLNQVGEVGNGYNAFSLGSVTVVNYNDTFTLANGSTDTPLADTEGLFAPRAQLGKIFFGPENRITSVGKSGARSFARTIMDSRGRSMLVESETNCLPVVEAPSATIKVDFTP